MIENLQGIHETVNFQGDTGLRLYVNREDASYPMHWHAPVEILCPLQQGYEVICNNQLFRLREEDILIICPGTLHTLAPINGGVRIIFQADCSVLYPIKQIETIFSLIAPALLINREVYPDEHRRMHSLVLEIRDEYLHNAPMSEALIYSKLLAMISLIGGNHTGRQGRFDTTTRKRREYNEKMLFICNHISEHCTEELSLDQMAALAGFSKFHFERLFKQFTGTTFYRYLNQKRIALAAEFLIAPDISVTEVAYRSGFSSVSSFIRMFKIVKHCTPSQFRKMHTA